MTKADLIEKIIHDSEPNQLIFESLTNLGFGRFNLFRGGWLWRKNKLVDMDYLDLLILYNASELSCTHDIKDLKLELIDS
jgi:hypothetical protein